MYFYFNILYNKYNIHIFIFTYYKTCKIEINDNTCKIEKRKKAFADKKCRVGEMGIQLISRVGKTGVCEMGIGETGVGEMGVGETGPNRNFITSI